MDKAHDSVVPMTGAIELSVLIPITERYDPVEELYQEYKHGLDRLNLRYDCLLYTSPSPRD